MKRVPKPLLYLASASPRRKDILTEMKIPFKVVKSRYREESFSHANPRILVIKHAEGKARKAVIPKAARFVLGADTIVYCRKKILGKPATEKKAASMLELLSGRGHDVFSGIVLWDRKTGKIHKRISRTRVFIKKLSPELIRRYILHVHSLDKAGAYAIQMKPKIVTRIQGSFSNVIGLPQEEVSKLLKRAGF